MNKHTEHISLHPGTEIATDLATTLVRFIFALPQHMGRLLVVWQKRDAQRHNLRMLDVRHLNDMGMTRTDVRHETEKGFWQV